jgi:1-deoxy-D-xylulose-5-phosphate synthase
MTVSKLIDKIDSPADLKGLDDDQLTQLAQEVRELIIETIGEIGGHFGANLGACEIAVAIHSLLDSPSDKVLWDVGHQAYPHKVLTGRRGELNTIRQYGGLAPFCSRNESPHDIMGAGHASTSVGYGVGLKEGMRMGHGVDGRVVAVIGDGAMTGGVAFEAVHLAGGLGTPLVVLLNDNGMSIAPNVGAINKYLGSIIASPMTVRWRERLKHAIEKASHLVGGPRLIEFAKNVEESVKNLWSPGMLFEELGFRYFGPIEGHDLSTLVATLDIVRKLKGPRLVHVLTHKGKGFPLPEPDLEKYHARAPYDPVTGVLKPVTPGPPQWTKVFGEAITQLAAEFPRLVAITAAMPSGTGTNIFQKKWPGRFFDVGRGTPSRLRRVSRPRGSVPSSRFIPRSCNGRTTASSTTLRFRSCRSRFAWTGPGWWGRTARPTWACTTFPTCSPFPT